MNNYLNLIKNKLLNNNNNKSKLFAGAFAFVACLAMLAAAFGLSAGSNPFDTSASADIFASTRDVKNCGMNSTTGYSYSGSATPGIVYDVKDLQGGVAPTQASEMQYKNTQGYARRGEQFGTVSVAPGMNIDFTNFVSNGTQDDVSGTSNTRLRLGEAYNLMQPGSANVKVENLSVEYINNTPRTINDNFLVLGETFRSSKNGETFKNGTASFKAIQPVTLVGQRTISYEYKEGKTFARLSATLKNNTVFTIAENELSLDTRVQNNTTVTPVALGGNEEKTVTTQLIDLGKSEDAVTLIESSIVNVKKKFVSTIVRKPEGNYNVASTPNMTDNAPGFVTRHAGSVTGNQIGSYPTKIDFTISVIPYSFSTNPNEVPRPAIKKVDAQLVKTTTTPIVKPGQQAEFKLSVTNVGEDKFTGFKLDDLMPNTFDMSTLQVEFDASRAKLVSRETTGNNFTSTFEFTDGGLNAGGKFDITIKIKAKADTNCKDAVTNFARISIEGYAPKQEQNQIAKYDLKDGCKAGDNNCSSSLVKFDCYVPKVGISLTKTIANQKTSYKSGDTLTYNFKVVNTGEEDVKGFSFTDVIPEGMDINSINGIENANNSVRIDNFKKDGKTITASFNFNDKFKKGASYEFSFKATLNKDIDCKALTNIARVSIEGFTDNGKKEESPVTDLSKGICLSGDNNCSTITLIVECQAPSFGLALGKTIIEPKDTYKEGETIKYNLAIKKSGKLNVQAFKVTDTIPSELASDSYVVAAPAGYTSSELKKQLNIDGSTTITFVVKKTDGSNISDTINVFTSANVKTGAKCKPITNFARVDVIDTTPAGTPICDALNNSNGVAGMNGTCSYGPKVENPSTNSNNGYCIVTAPVAGKGTLTVGNCVKTCSPTDTTLTAGTCVLKTCVTGDDNCSQVTTNLFCEPTPITIVPKTETPRTGAPAALAYSSIVLGLISVVLMWQSKNRKANIEL
jgi:fimbrial isopeptide formation D2 family protein